MKKQYKITNSKPFRIGKKHFRKKWSKSPNKKMSNVLIYISRVYAL